MTIIRFFLYKYLVVILIWLTEVSDHNDDGSCELLEVDSPLVPLSFALNKTYALFRRQNTTTTDKDQEDNEIIRHWYRSDGVNTMKDYHSKAYYSGKPLEIMYNPFFRVWAVGWEASS